MTITINYNNDTLIIDNILTIDNIQNPIIMGCSSIGPDGLMKILYEVLNSIGNISYYSTEVEDEIKLIKIDEDIQTTIGEW